MPQAYTKEASSENLAWRFELFLEAEPHQSGPAAEIVLTRRRNLGEPWIRPHNPEHGVDRESVLSGRYELEVATQCVPAEIFLDPLYDPTMSRVKS
jgi:hypothetical protein